MSIATQGSRQIQALEGTSRKLPGLSFFFPAHNEEANVLKVIADALQTLPGVADDYEIICVDDGSSDNTAEIVRMAARANTKIRLVSHESNQGYGAALQSGFQAARHPWIFFTDGDGQFSLDELREFAALATSWDTGVIGYRIRRQDPWYRKLNAACYKALVRVLLGVKARDIDCAYKLLPTHHVKSLKLTSSGALISAELLMRLQGSGLVFTERGVRHYPRQAGVQSGASPVVVLRMFAELGKLMLRMRREKARLKGSREAV